MHNIRTQAKPYCDLCDTGGVTVQSNVSDPDGQISGVWSIKKCANPDCNTYWLDPAPLQTELWKAYTSYHTHARDRSGKFNKNILSLVNRFIKLILLPVWFANGLKQEMNQMRFMTLDHEPAGKLLDVGCGAGRFINRMRKRGWDVEGIDFDPQAANRVMTRYGIVTHIGDLVECALPASSFDVITMSQAVEHLYDPRAVLFECVRILKPGGKLIITTPNVNSIGAAEFGAYWRGWEAPRHLHLFSTESLKHLAQQCGFEIIEARTYSSDSAGIYRVSKLKQMKENGKISFFDQLWLLGWGYHKEMREHRLQQSSSNTGQNVLVRARKPVPSPN